MFYLTKALSSGLLSARRERLIRRRGCVIWPGGKPCISLINSAERRTPTKCIFRLRALVCQCKCCAPTGLTAGSLSVSHLMNSDDPIQSMSVVVYWPPQLQAVDGLGVDVSAPRCPEDPDDPIPSHRPGPIRIGYPRGRPSPVLGHRRR
jgi:hypothetical protein